MSLYDDLLKLEEVEEIVATAPKVEKPILQQAIQNLPSSTLQLGKDIVQPLLQPITTAKSIFSLGKGIIELAIPGEQKDEETVRNVGRYFANRYGGLENIKKTFAQDPAGFLADASIVLTGGGTLAAKTPQLAKIGQAAKTIGTAIDPVTGAIKATGVVGKGVGFGTKQLAGMTTGVGAEAITKAVEAGRVGKEAQARFIQNLRGKADPGDVANRAFDALKKMGSERAAQYTHGIEGLKLAETPINFQPISKAMDDIVKESSYKGIAKYSDATLKKIEELKSVVDEFKANQKTHTAEGLDILKRKVDDLYPLQQQASQEGRMVAGLRDKVKKEIVEQVPDYADVMRPYEQAIKLEKEIANELSLGKKANAGTTLRKLQSTMRNNVNTAYGNRLELLNKLDPELLPDLSGQALSEIAPRGLQRGVGAGAAAYGAFVDPLILAGLPLQSPRLVGETALKAGQAQRILGGLPITQTLRSVRPIVSAQEPEQKLTSKDLENLEELNRLLQ